MLKKLFQLFYAPQKGNKQIKEKKQIILRNRGYLGPIGDDIPSLIPIIVGLITFFAAFTFTLNEYNLRTQSVTADRDTLIVANTLKGDSYISTHQEFEAACTGLRIRGLEYAAGIIPSVEWEIIAAEAQNNPDQPFLSRIMDHFYVIENHTLSCEVGLEAPYSVQSLGEILSNRNYVALIFPVALEVPTAVVPATLVVITWRA